MTIKCLLLNKQLLNKKSTDEEVELTYPPLSQPSVQLLLAQLPSCGLHPYHSLPYLSQHVSQLYHSPYR